MKGVLIPVPNKQLVPIAEALASLRGKKACSLFVERVQDALPDNDKTTAMIKAAVLDKSKIGEFTDLLLPLSHIAYLIEEYNRAVNDVAEKGRARITAFIEAVHPEFAPLDYKFKRVPSLDHAIVLKVHSFESL